MDNASNVALLKTVEVAHPDHYKFQVDEQSILHQQQKKTNAIANSVRSRWRFKYDRGLMFFIYRDGLALRSPLPSDAFVFKIKHNHEELIDVLIDEGLYDA